MQAICDVSALQPDGRTVKKIDGKQLLICQQSNQVFVVDNRCPHEGYPLSEGHLSDDCQLTCNWHNWKFDLTSGETLVGGDQLRHYPCQVVNGEVWADLSDLPLEQQQSKALQGLHLAFKEHDYTRMARELVRYHAADGCLDDALVAACEWAAPELSYGMTHAYAAAPQWLRLADEMKPNTDLQLLPWLECIGHLSWDVLQDVERREFTTRSRAYDGAAMAIALDNENEDLAISYLNGALAAAQYQTVLLDLQRWSFTHYQGFGHSVIYAHQAQILCARLGPGSHSSVLQSLVRFFIMASREDLIPEFKAYARGLAQFQSAGGGSAVLRSEQLRHARVGKAVDLVVGALADPQTCFDQLLLSAAEAVLHFDTQRDQAVTQKFTLNASMLDVSHTLTHLLASRALCQSQPDLWPQALLQSACFIGRNSAFVNSQLQQAQWQVDEPEVFFTQSIDRLLDHGEPLYIYPAHWLKMTMAIRDQVRNEPEAIWVPTLLAALNRFLHEPIKRKHMQRDLLQAQQQVLR